MSRRLYLEPEPDYKPKFFTHAAWCAWLQSRGCLSPQHRMCVRRDTCVAKANQPVEESWRSARRA